MSGENPIRMGVTAFIFCFVLKMNGSDALLVIHHGSIFANYSKP